MAHRVARLTFLPLLLPLALLLTAGCTSVTHYRPDVASDCVVDLASGARPCDTSSFYRVRRGDDEAYVAVVEFDDEGSLVSNDDDHYEETLRRIEAVHRSHGASMVLFAHGWKHSAAPGDSNLEEFEELLLQLDAADDALCGKAACGERRTVGVFLAWRGLSARAEPFKSLSFWGRKRRAHTVGENGAPKLLADLDTVSTRAFPEGGNERGNKFIIVGHSFGGALVYSAIHARLVGDLAEPNRRGTVPRRVADLVVLVNPAFEAARFDTLHRGARRHTFSDSQHPVLAVFTSEDDDATKKAFPFGRWFSTRFNRYNPRHPDQAKADRTAIGHFDPYRTHELTPAGAAEVVAAEDPLGLEDLVCDWRRFRHGDTDTWTAQGARLERLSVIGHEGQYSNPYLLVRVAGEIIPDHSRIWEDAFRDFLYTFVSVQDRREDVCR
jgi:pimeloyl-ACP methyl ester carboxylesterase